MKANVIISSFISTYSTIQLKKHKKEGNNEVLSLMGISKQVIAFLKERRIFYLLNFIY